MTPRLLPEPRTGRVAPAAITAAGATAFEERQHLFLERRRERSEIGMCRPSGTIQSAACGLARYISAPALERARLSSCPGSY